ncbi:hypothetical protein PRK78_002056 [Emydomyces testavorans]|uniref:Uncharacterized protein n=1 Tax=Emydomyces testavorans TaxID=2070801 RepID=A0AAF0IH91_9EURO|nr:hypothetical protein PRK78_002056 [Emydomyces testavorans]
MQPEMGFAVREGSEASELSASDCGTSPFSRGPSGVDSGYSGFTTPGSTGDGSQVAQALAEKNRTLLELGPYSEANISELNDQCHHDGLPDKFHTCPHPYHSSYNEGNLPLLLFMLEPPEQSHSEPVGHLMENGRPVLDFQGNPVRNFPFLPRYISVKPTGWLIEFWMRSDTRLTYRDIKARMPVAKAELPSDNVLNMRRERDARKPLGLSCWTARRGGVTRAEIERVELLSPENVAYNTALKVRCDLQPPVLESRSFYPHATPQYYPFDTFLDGSKQLHTPGRRLDDSIQLLFELQVLTTDLGVDDWRKLPESKLPEWWARSKGKGNAELSSTNQSQQSSQVGSVFSTPKSSSKRRMSWRTPQKSVLSTVCNGQAFGGFKTPEKNFANASPSSILFSGGGAIGFTGHSHQNNSPAYGVAMDNGMTESPSPFSNYQSRPRLGLSRRENSPLSGYNNYDTDRNMVLNESPVKLTPLQEQAHLALAAMTRFAGSMDDYSAFDDPYLDDSLFPQPHIDYAAHFGDLAMQVFNHNQAPSSCPSFTRQSPATHRFNGHAGFSIRQNQVHKLNTNTNEIMGRNDPFTRMRSHEASVSSKGSFEDFIGLDLPF